MRLQECRTQATGKLDPQSACGILSPPATENSARLIPHTIIYY